MAQKFGLVHSLPEDLRKIYLQFGIDLPKHNGDDSWTLPLAARFIIDGEGTRRQKKWYGLKRFFAKTYQPVAAMCSLRK